MRYLSVLLIMAVLLLPSTSFAARGFGTTDGTASTDVITTTVGTSATTMSYVAWIWRTGSGGGALGRIFDKDSAGAGHRRLLEANAASTLNFHVSFSTSPGEWSIAKPADAGWHQVIVTYDGGSVSNDPIIYLDGASVTVTETLTPVGSIGSSSGAYTLGNRAAVDRNWNGRLGEIAIFENTILTAGNVTTLWNGGLGRRADSLPIAPTHYWKLCAQVAPEPNEILGGSTGAVTGALSQAHPFANCQTKKSGMHR